jgi:hypothetical protein
MLAKPLAAAKIRRSVCFVQTSDVFDATLLEQQNIRPIGQQTIGEENVSGTKDVPQFAEQADLALSLAGVAADPEIHDGSTG